MLSKIEEIYYYPNIKDSLINYLPANKTFRELTGLDPLTAPKGQIITKLKTRSDIGAIKKILSKLEDQYIINRDSNKKIQIIKIGTNEVKPLDYYKKPENLKQLRKEMGYTQKDFGYKMGFDSIRRGSTILEKENGITPITDRDARLAKYIDLYGDLDSEQK